MNISSWLFVDYLPCCFLHTDRIGWKQHPYTLSIYQSLLDILQKNENEALKYAEEFETMYEQIYEPLEKHILAEEDRSR